VRRVGQEAPQPGLVRRRTEREPGGIDAIQLFAQPVRQSPFLDAELFDEAGQLPQVHDLRVVGAHRAKGATVRPQGICDDVGVAAIVFGAAGGKPVPKPIELFWIHGEDGEALFDHRID
jgi:hypothetical protein